eukprot:scaffold263055_cov31-Attheya_sp.AAC.1
MRTEVIVFDAFHTKDLGNRIVDIGVVVQGYATDIPIFLERTRVAEALGIGKRGVLVDVVSFEVVV